MTDTKDKRPVIGLVPLEDKARNSYWMLPGYMNGVFAAGGIPFMLPLTKDKPALLRLFNMCGGLLFTGGQDVNPNIYGAEKTELCGEASDVRDFMEEYLLELAVSEDKAVLGICRGIQFMNASLGGTLYDDIPARIPSDLIHCQKPPYDLPSHSVTIDINSPLGRLLGRERLDVNSYHHQGIRELSPKLTSMAVSDDGLTEAVYMPQKRFIWGIQWHPELSYKTDENSLKIFKEFIRFAER